MRVKSVGESVVSRTRFLGLRGPKGLIPSRQPITSVKFMKGFRVSGVGFRV